MATHGSGARFLLEVFAAFTQSPQWERGVFVLVYDEWGGFFDHVAPPMLPGRPLELARRRQLRTGRVSSAGGAGVAVHVRHGYVDHRRYDHTSILRFIEWRFLGAPPEGPGQGRASWSLTKRDRFANNVGASLRPDAPEPEVGIEVNAIAAPSDACGGETPTDPSQHQDKFEPSDQLADLIDAHYPSPTLTPWLDDPAPRKL